MLEACIELSKQLGMGEASLTHFVQNRDRRGQFPMRLSPFETGIGFPRLPIAVQPRNINESEPHCGK